MPNDLRYPIGSVQIVEELSDLERNNHIDEIASVPELLRQALSGLEEDQLETPYRPDGWTVRQLVHHIADSHLNAYIRFRWALTEDFPLIKAYDQNQWAKLPDACDGPVEESVTLIDALHRRWCRLMRAMDKDDWKREVNHPEDGIRSCQDFLIIYAWHGLHHIAHITNLRERQGW